MKYLEVRQDALELIEKERAEADKAKREAGAKRIKRLMLEIDLMKSNLKMAEEQLEDMMGQDVEEPSRLLSRGTVVVNNVVLGDINRWARWGDNEK